jgi:hypothetical protein
MSTNLKKLVVELDQLLVQRGDSLDAPTRDEFRSQIESLKRAIDEANAVEVTRLCYEALNVLAALLSIITNVKMLLG